MTMPSQSLVAPAAGTEDRLLDHSVGVAERMLRLIERTQALRSEIDRRIAEAISRVAPYVTIGAVPPFARVLYQDCRGARRRLRAGESTPSGALAKLTRMEQSGYASGALFLDEDATLWEAEVSAVLGRVTLHRWHEGARTSPDAVLAILHAAERVFAERLEAMEQTLQGRAEATAAIVREMTSVAPPAASSGRPTGRIPRRLHLPRR